LTERYPLSWTPGVIPRSFFLKMPKVPLCLGSPERETAPRRTCPGRPPVPKWHSKVAFAPSDPPLLSPFRCHLRVFPFPRGSIRRPHSFFFTPFDALIPMPPTLHQRPFFSVFWLKHLSENVDQLAAIVFLQVLPFCLWCGRVGFCVFFFFFSLSFFLGEPDLPPMSVQLYVFMPDTGAFGETNPRNICPPTHRPPQLFHFFRRLSESSTFFSPFCRPWFHDMFFALD